MTDYNLHGLNPRDFQHLIQAIARREISPGVQAFGDGRDGNRDLVHTGTMNFPSLAAPWSGYLVVGCKFRQRSAANDTEWALAQLEHDLKKFLDPNKQLKCPEYYLFVTNVTLSGVSSSGGIDRVQAKLAEYISQLNLKDAKCWHYRDICGFIDCHTDIRHAYGHFVTPGDILAEIATRLRCRSANFAHAMRTALQKELIADVSARLDSVGSDLDAQVPLANVFVDLPATSRVERAARPIEITVTGKYHEADIPRVVEWLLGISANVFRQQSADEGSSSSSEDETKNETSPRHILIGGPGQGKSTLGQYLCQILRSAILQDAPKDRLDKKALQIIRQIRENRGELPLARRYPIRIELKQYSQSKANNPDLGVLEYVRRQISRLGGTEISKEDLHDWLGAYPWLLVIDGLDEVPPSDVRTQVIRDIEDFRIDTVSANADIMIIATTRPQNYSNELADQSFTDLYLTPLSQNQALAYGERLAQCRCAGDEQRCEELLKKLEKACQKDVTAGLMQSPLQVTIMADLLEDLGEPPQLRYRLFSEYYRKIYKREMRRGLLSGILNEHQTDIDTIHARAGLQLHAAGELYSATNSNRRDATALSDEQFRELVRHRLAETGIDGGEAATIVARITDSSLQRLVFLVRPTVEPKVRFEIQPLQEFMAAEAIMNGPDDSVRMRVRHVAAAAYWRNVFLFCVGRCFAEKEHLLDSVVAICSELNSREPSELLNDKAGEAAAETYLGSRLAIDILAEGSARRHRRHERQLAKIALEAVACGDAGIAARLSAVYQDHLENEFRNVISVWLGQADFERQRGAWLLTLGLADRAIRWAVDLASRKWPQDREHQSKIIGNYRPHHAPHWSTTKFIDLVPHCSPEVFYRYAIIGPQVEAQLPHWCKIALNAGVARGRQVVRLSNRIRGLAPARPFVICSAGAHDNPLKSLLDSPLNQDNWAYLMSAARFWEAPTAAALAKELRWLAGVKFSKPPIRIECPWPLAACLAVVKARDDLLSLSAKAEAGELGSSDDWLAAEKRWLSEGIIDSDFFAMTDDNWPFHAGIGTVGFPFVCCDLQGVAREPDTNSIAGLRRAAPGAMLRRFLSWILWNSLSIHRDELDPGRRFRCSPVELKSIVDDAAAFRGLLLSSSRLMSIDIPDRLNSDWIGFFAWFGERVRNSPLLLPKDSVLWPPVAHLASVFSAAPEQNHALLRALVLLVRLGFSCHVPRSVLEVSRAWGQEAEEDAIELLLAGGDWNDADIGGIVDVILRSPNARSRWAEALRLVRCHLSIDPAVDLGLALMRKLSSGECAGSDLQGFDTLPIVDLCHQFLQVRPSSLIDHKVWKKLKLPVPV